MWGKYVTDPFTCNSEYCTIYMAPPFHCSLFIHKHLAVTSINVSIRKLGNVFLGISGQWFMILYRKFQALFGAGYVRLGKEGCKDYTHPNAAFVEK